MIVILTLMEDEGVFLLDCMKSAIDSSMPLSLSFMHV